MKLSNHSSIDCPPSSNYRNTWPWRARPQLLTCTALLAVAACGAPPASEDPQAIGSNSLALSDIRNVARDAGVVVRAQSTFPGYAAQKAVDGDTNTTVGPEHSWVNAHTSGPDGRLPQWFEVDLGAARDVERVVLYTSQGFPIKDYDVQAWDGTSWTVLVSQRGNRQTRVEHSFAATTTNKLRVVGLRGPDAQSIYVRINELEIYGRDAEPGSPIDVDTLEEGAGWERVRITGPDDGGGGTITDELTIVAPGASGVPLPPGVLEDLAADAASPYIVSEWVVDELLISEAQGGLTPRLAEIAEPEDPPSATARLFGRCSNREKRVTKSISSHAGFSEDAQLFEGLRGEFEIGGEIDVEASADVRMTQKRYAVFGKCIPYAASFQSAQLDGQLSVEKGARVAGRLVYTHHWQKQLAKPYLGGVWLMAGPIPVWIEFTLPIDVGVDISASVEAGLTYTANETASGSFSVLCASDGCDGSATWNLPQRPVSELVEASLEGNVHVDPWVEVRLQAALYHEDLVSIAAGLRPTLQAHVWGYLGSACGDADQDGSNEMVRALMGDLGVTVYLTGTTSTLGTVRRSPDLWHQGFHIAFANLLNDWSAAQPMLAGPAVTSANVGTLYQVSMRPCWPFDGNVEYQLDNGAGAAYFAQGAALSPQPVAVSWNGSGRYSLTATALGDDRGRDFGAAIARPVDVLGAVERNLSLDPGVTAAAQSTFSGYSPAKVVDGDASTALGPEYSWANAHDTAPNGRLPQWLDVDLGGAYQIERIRLYTSADFPLRDYDLQAWDGSSWITLDVPRDNTAAMREHDISIYASKVRVLSRRGPSGQPSYARVNELEIYGY